jgi:hypothetical protein
MIGLVDFLTASGITFNTQNTKVHLACWTGQEDPIDEYFAGRFQGWQEHQTKQNFNCDHVLSLIDLRLSRWLFVGIYDILGRKVHPTNPDQHLYTTQLRPNSDELIGRVIVEHVRTRQSYIWLKPEIKLPIREIRGSKMTVGEFPGYNHVLVNHATLRVITQQVVPSWHAALRNIKGVYLITDTSTGKQYVGKASGDVGIWQRWCAYADNGHGGNVKLKAMLNEKGPEHVGHFQYSILEIADTHASDQDILARESYWMNVLKTREFGLN